MNLLAKSIRNNSLLLDELRFYHRDTYNHSIRVAKLSFDMGKALYFPSIYQEYLCTAGLLHDIGKVKIPIEILDCETGLNIEQRKIIEKHPTFGYQILISHPIEIIKKIVVAHHEFKINSYPRRSPRGSDELVNKLSQIVAIADIYDALISARSYKEPMGSSTILQILQEQYTGNSEYINLIMGGTLCMQ